MELEAALVLVKGSVITRKKPNRIETAKYGLRTWRDKFWIVEEPACGVSEKQVT